MLSSAVLALLADGHSRSLAKTADAIATSLDNPDEQEFRLACDLLFMLEETVASSSASDASVIARVLNAEYLLYKFYERYGSIEMNPFLSHFVSVYSEGLKAFVSSRESLFADTAENDVQMVQTTLVSLFLVDGGHTVGELKAADFPAVWPDLIRDNIDTDRFVDALVNQGVMDPPVPESRSSVFSDPGGAGGGGSQQRELAVSEHRPNRGNAEDSNVKHPMPIRVIPNPITSTDVGVGDEDMEGARLSMYVRPMLKRALSEELSEKETHDLVNILKQDPIMLMGTVDLSVNAITAMLHMNPLLGRSLITSLLLTALREDVLQILQYLPPSLPALEALSHLLIPQLGMAQQVGSGTTPVLREDEKSLLLHPFLSNATRLIESQQSKSYGTGEDYQMQTTRPVQLLCLFIQSLLRTGTIELEEYVYEIQSLALSFVYVPEATELFHVVQSAMAKHLTMGPGGAQQQQGNGQQSQQQRQQQQQQSQSQRTVPVL
ncbi:hypothetical protein BZA70DRAFT_272404 [Myxozyma melibiosi]|uniref:CCR4-NOT transcription complex subunit 11 n=1 Tax=Myxozyma melibiosi TaxID=54550 RepID=A0ABR1FFP2_9ASCO